MSQATVSTSPPPVLQTTEQATVSIVIPVYNQLEAVYRLLGSLGDTVRTGTEILVQDDASPTVDMSQMPVPSFVKVARNTENLGFAGNCNAGAMRSTGRYLLFLNQDTRTLHPGWLEAMVNVFETRPNVGIVGPKLVFPNGGIQSCGGWFDSDRGPFHRYLGWQDVNDRRVNTTEQVSWVTGAALMIPRNLFYAVGGFDVGYTRGYFEDVDLAMKVQVHQGKEVWYCAEATLEHSVGSTGGNPYFRRNSMRFHGLWDRYIEPDTFVKHVDY